MSNEEDISLSCSESNEQTEIVQFGLGSIVNAGEGQILPDILFNQSIIGHEGADTKKKPEN